MKRIVVIGGGFAGVACVRALCRNLGSAAEVVLFSAENHFVYNPMLAETVGATLSPFDIVVPLRELLPRAFCRTERVHDIDLANRRVTFESFGARIDSLTYDKLVIACGNTANLGAVPGMADHAFPLKTIGDALALRSHVMDQLEWAEVCDSRWKSRVALATRDGDWIWALVLPRDLSHLKPRVTDRVTRAHYRSGDYIVPTGEAPRAFVGRRRRDRT